MGGRGERHVTINMRDLYDPSSVPRRLERDLFTSNKDYQASIARTRADAVRRNFAMVYASIYVALFGGRVTPHGPRGNGSLDGESHYFPDVVHISEKPKARTDVEIKSFSINFTGQSPCSVPQFESYFARMLRRVDSREYPASRVNLQYGFFRYELPAERTPMRGRYPAGQRKYRKSAETPLANLSRDGFLEFLGKSTRDLLVVPPNLLALLFANASGYNHPQQSPSGANIVNKPYRHVKSGDISALHSTNGNGEGIEKLLQRHRRDHEYPWDKGHVIGVFEPSDLMLNRLRAVQEESPRIIINGEHEVKPFVYTVYEFNSPRDITAWNRFLQSRHADLLVRTLKVRDLHSEAADIPI